MKLAVNYSLPLQKLLDEKAISVDLIKCPEWDGLVNPALRLGDVYIHFDINIGDGSVNKLEPSIVQYYLTITNTPHLNVHLQGDKKLDPHSLADQRQLLNRWKEDIQHLQKQFPGVRIVAENLPFLPGHEELEIANNAEIITKLIRDTGIFLLLDLSHIRITAHYSGKDYKSLVSALPTDRLQEMHLTGAKIYNNVLMDHFELTPEDVEAAQWAIGQIKDGNWAEPEIVAFEYGGVGDVFGWRCSEQVLREQVPLLYSLIHS